MIFVTGDTHGQIDYYKLKRFAQDNKYLTKKDFVIIAGDYGAIWDKDSLEADLDEYSKLPWTTLFVDGNHENFDIINSYPVEIWKGGKIHKIREDIIHLMRGQVFELEGKTIFTFGGGTSIDRAIRIEGLSWWRQEMPTYDDVDEGDRNLSKYNRTVDYIITHSCSLETLYKMSLYPWSLKRKRRKDGEIILEHEFRVRREKLAPCLDNAFISSFETVKYKHWYFGHYHLDCWISENQRAIYQDILRLE